MLNFLSSAQQTRFTDPSLLPTARVFKCKVLEKMKGYPPLSRFFGEDRITTTLAVRLGFRYKYTLKIKVIKIDEPSYQAYWKKHFRYGKGIVHDIVPLIEKVYHHKENAAATPQLVGGFTGASC